MEQHSEARARFPPFLERLIEEARRQGRLEGLLESRREGEIEGYREILLRLLNLAGIAITEAERTRILACNDTEILGRWVENILGAKTADDVFA
jgi:predicted transposase YdaD